MKGVRGGIRTSIVSRYVPLSWSAGRGYNSRELGLDGWSEGSGTVKKRRDVRLVLVAAVPIAVVRLLGRPLLVVLSGTVIRIRMTWACQSRCFKNPMFEQLIPGGRIGSVLPRFLVFVLLAGWGGFIQAEEAREIGLETQLFVDDWILDDLQGAVRRLNPLRKHPQNPILKPDRPWEGDYTAPNFVVYDEADRLFKMWYVYIKRESKRGDPHLKPGRKGLAYAVSRDGVNWEKSELGLVTVPGFGKKTNTVPHVPSIYDTHESDPQKRYKAVIGTGDRSRGMVDSIVLVPGQGPGS